jgi:GDP-L-fucose synthase
MTCMKKNEKIFVAGHIGLAGSAIVRRLRAGGYHNLLTRTRQELDLTDQQAVAAFFASEKPDNVFLAAAKVGGIYANQTFPAEFIQSNLAIELNVIHQSWLHGAKRLLFLGSSCIYPKLAPQPMQESALMTGLLEPSNEPYAVAKIAGIEMCWAYNRQFNTQFIPLMPTNLYGPGDNYDLLNAHVLPALIRKFHLATLAQKKDWQAIWKDERRFGPIPLSFKQSLGMTHQGGFKDDISVQLWGSGSPLREFLFSDDLAEACIFMMEKSWEDILAAPLPGAPLLFNVGSGKEQSIKTLSEKVARIVGYEGRVNWDASMPDGAPRKFLDISLMERLGWQASTTLDSGVQQAYQWYLEQT